MTDQHITAIATIVQDVLLFVSAALVAWYLCETRRLRTTSQGQLGAMREQLEAMRNAGRQTDNLIERAREQVGALQIAANAAEKNAGAAKVSADALINTERAWIMAAVKWTNSASRLAWSESGDRSITTGAHVTLTCKNHGKTPAWITEIQIRLEATAAGPSNPIDLKGAEMFYGPQPLAPDEEFYLSRLLTGEGRADLGKMTLIYGTVKYRDVFTVSSSSADRQTWFGYRVTQDGSLERIAHPEYNRNS